MNEGHFTQIKSIKMNGIEVCVIDTEVHFFNPYYEYYYRRGSRVYFRNGEKRVSFTINEIQNKFKRGQEYILDFKAN